MRTYAEIDIDCGQFPIADLSLDLHWIQLPTSVLLERRKAERVAREKERAAALPANHKIILVPADPTYSPIDDEFWSIINRTSRGVRESAAAVDRVLEDPSTSSGLPS